MKKIEHEDMVLFDTKEQLEEYIRLSMDENIYPEEVEGIFPRIQSKHWFSSLSPEKPTSEMLKSKIEYINRLQSYESYKQSNDD